jgi:methionyl-tRNA formyltransferase
MQLFSVTYLNFLLLCAVYWLNFTFMNIVFMGTPELAAYCLRQILKTNHKVMAVVTAPDKPAGRGLKLKMSEVKVEAIKNGIPILQPDNLDDASFIEELKKINADLFVVVAFRKLPHSVWSLPPKKTINLHASLLPQYRGAAPINWAIINGEKTTGVTVFFINDEIDTGNIIAFEEVGIPHKCTAGKLHDILKVKGAELLIHCLDLIEQNKVEVIEQSSFIIDKQLLKKAPKIYHNMCEIDWSKNAKQIAQFIYGLSPSPGAFMYMKNIKNGKIISVKILNVDVIDGMHSSPNKTIITDNKNYWYIAVDGGLLQVEECQVEGKKAMDVKSFLNGFRNLNEWVIL